MRWLPHLFLLAFCSLVAEATVNIDCREHPSDVVRYSLPDSSSLPQSSLPSGAPRRVRRMAGALNAVRWNNTIGYRFSDDLSPMHRDLVLEAIHFFEEKTCLSFVPTSNTPAFPPTLAPNQVTGIEFSDGNMCFSHLGNILHFPLYLDVVYVGCAIQVEDVIRVLAHALGMVYEHQRPDRDNYLSITSYAMSDENVKFFMKEPLAQKSPEYDEGSVMQFGHCLKYHNYNSDTLYSIRAHKPYSYTIGSHRVQGRDLFAFNNFYKCKEKNCKGVAAPKCLNGGQQHPRDCTSCLCPPMFDGKMCGKRSAGIKPFNGKQCGADYIATSTPQEAALYLKTPLKPAEYKNTECYYWFKRNNTDKDLLLEIQDFYQSKPSKSVNCLSGVQIYLQGNYNARPITFCDMAQLDDLGMRSIRVQSDIMVRIFRTDWGKDATESVDSILAVTFRLQ